jgi:hypothetical protein
VRLSQAWLPAAGSASGAYPGHRPVRAKVALGIFVWLILPGTKTTKSLRKIPIAQPLGEFLRVHQEPMGPVVPRWPNVRRDLATACINSGIARVSPNDLRRTFASWLKQQGVDSMTVAKLLGHTSSRMVELVYGHLDSDTYKRAIALLPAPALPPEFGSTLVAEADIPGGRMRRMRQLGEGDSPTETGNSLVPRTGIEPVTRGFSGRPRWAPRPRLREVFPRLRRRV